MKRAINRVVLFVMAAFFSFGREQRNLDGAMLPVGMKPDIVVAGDGSGDFATLQGAIDSVPKGNRERKVIFIKNGTYKKHMRVENSFLTLLLREHRMKTRIVWEINDPRNEPNGNADHKGTASFNLNNASIIVIDNLTIDNPAKLGLKPITVYSTGQGTRIVIENAEVTGLGVIRCRCWTNGMCYHRNIHVTGTYHFVGPRGTCYMSDSLIGKQGSVTNMLFNEGKTDERQKFVLQRCKLISKMPFGLGSNFNDASWYFVDCEFPATLRPEGKIFIAQPDTAHPKPVSEMFKWATDRIYFAGSLGPLYPGLMYNIEKSPAKTAAAVNAAWTFWGEWDPESTVAPAVVGVTRQGDSVNVKFSEAVTVKGEPTIKLADGKMAEYASGSGTDTLSFVASKPATPRTLELNGSGDGFDGFGAGAVYGGFGDVGEVRWESRCVG